MPEITLNICQKQFGKVMVEWSVKKSAGGDIIQEDQESFEDDLLAALVCATRVQTIMTNFSASMKVKLTVSLDPGFNSSYDRGHLRGARLGASILRATYPGAEEKSHPSA